jgi:hypothetical protein
MDITFPFMPCIGNSNKSANKDEKVLGLENYKQ